MLEIQSFTCSYATDGGIGISSLTRDLGVCDVCYKIKPIEDTQLPESYCSPRLST